MVSKAFDILVLGASGFTGRQLVHALLRQSEGRGLRIALAGRRPEALAALQSGLDIITADAADERAMARLARSGRVLLNLAGPYAERGDGVVAACVAGACHYLDLSGETFWMRQMLLRHHETARQRGVLVVPACGFEALPFDLVTQAVARQLLLRQGERCVRVDIGLRLTGPAIHRLSDAVSGGTLASMRAILEHDQTHCLQRMDCLLPEPPEALPPGWNANAVALANAAPLSPWWDADWGSVMAPLLPAPFINPPLVLRSVALNAEAFAPGFRYREGLQMRDSVEQLLGPLARALPATPWVQASLGGTSRAAQWSGAATLAAPLAALAAAAGKQRSLGHQALQRLIELVGPKPGEGPRPEALDQMGYELQVRAEGEGGTLQRGLLRASGHPGYRSTPEMMAALGLALAEGRIGAQRAGLLSPGAAFGSAALPLLEDAGLRWTLETSE